MNSMTLHGYSAHTRPFSRVRKSAYYSNLRQHDGGPPPLRSIQHVNGLPDLSPHQLLQVEESQEIHRRSSMLCTAVFQPGGFADNEQPLNSLAWQEPFYQHFLQQCSCYFCCIPSMQMGSRLVQNLGYRSNIQQSTKSCRYLLSQSTFQFSRKKTSRRNLHQFPFS